MHVFKRKPGNSTIHPVDRDVFEEQAAKRPPSVMRGLKLWIIPKKISYWNR